MVTDDDAFTVCDSWCLQDLGGGVFCFYYTDLNLMDECVLDLVN